MDGLKKTANKYQLQYANNEVREEGNKLTADETENNMATAKRRRLLHRYVYHTHCINGAAGKTTLNMAYTALPNSSLSFTIRGYSLETIPKYTSEQKLVIQVTAWTSSSPPFPTNLKQLQSRSIANMPVLLIVLSMLL